MGRFKRKIGIILMLFLIISVSFSFVSQNNNLKQEVQSVVDSAPKAEAQAGTRQVLRLLQRFRYRTDRAGSQKSECLPGGTNYYRDYARGCAFVEPGYYGLDAAYQLSDQNQCTWIRGLTTMRRGGCFDKDGNPYDRNYETDPISGGYDKDSGFPSYISNFNVEFTYNPADNSEGPPGGGNRAKTIARFITKNVTIDNYTEIAMKGCKNNDASNIDKTSVCRTPGFDDGYRITLVPTWLQATVVDIDLDPRVYTTGVLADDAVSRTLVQGMPTNKTWVVPGFENQQGLTFAQRAYTTSANVNCGLNTREANSTQDTLYNASTGTSLFRTFNSYGDNYAVFGQSSSVPASTPATSIPTGQYNIIIDVFDMCDGFQASALSDAYMLIQQLTPPAVPNTCTNMGITVPGVGTLTNYSYSLSSPTPVNVYFNGSAANPSGVAKINAYVNNVLQAAPISKTAAATPTGGNGYTVNIPYSFAELKTAYASNTVITLKAVVPGTLTETSCFVTINYIAPLSPTLIFTGSGTGAVNVACTAATNPYTIRFVIRTTTPNAGASITKVATFLAPENDTYDYRFAADGNGSNGLGNAIYISSWQGVNANASPGTTVATTPITQVPLKAEWLFQFDVTFTNATEYTRFFNYNTYRLGTYILDSTGATNRDSLGRGQYGFSNSFSPLDSCATLYYKTAKGDVRSVEKRAITSGNSAYKRILRVTNSINLTINTAALTSLKESDYSFEGLGVSTASECALMSRLYSATRTPYCVDPFQGASAASVNSTYAFSQMQTLKNSLSQELTSTDNLVYVVDVSKSIIGIPGVSAIGGGVKIDLGNAGLNNKTQKIIYKIDNLGGGTKVDVFDSYTTTAPSNVVIWCVVKGCNMQINPLVIVDKYNTNASFDSIDAIIKGNASVTDAKLYLRKNNRFYFNFLDSSETTADSATRAVKLTSPVDSQKYYYNGAIITSGYLYSNSTNNVNVLKGLFSGRGIVVNGSGSGISNRDIFFRNFVEAGYVNPVVFIDYDPKYTFVLNDLISQPSETVPRNIVGL